MNVFRIICFFLVFYGLSGFSLAHTSPILREIRAGFFLYNGFFEKDSLGTRSGYGHEYLQEIARLAGWKIQYIDGTWNECLEMLERGEIDLLLPMEKTATRETQFAFPDLPGGYSYGTLTTSSEQMKYFYNDYSSFSGMKVGLLQGNSRNETLFNFAREKQFEFEPVYMDSQETLVNALIRREIDAIGGSNLRRLENGEQILTKFSPAPFYVAVAQDKLRVLHELNSAQQAMNLDEPLYCLRLFQKSYTDISSQRLPLTRKEDRAVTVTPPLKAVYLDWLNPFSYASGDIPCSDKCRQGNGHVCSFRGVAADILREVSRDLGISFAFVPVKSTEQALQLLAKGEADLFCFFEHNHEIADKYGLHLSDPYLSTPYVRVINKNIEERPFQRLALPFLFKKMGVHFQKGTSASISHTTYYDNTQECFNAVLSGQADLTYANIYTANRLLLAASYQDLMIANVERFFSDVCFAFGPELSEDLTSALNKSISGIPQSSIQRFLADNMLTGKAFSLQEFAREYFLEILCGGFLILLGVLGTLGYVLYMRASGNKRVAEALNTDSLTGLPSFKKFREEGQAIVSAAKRRRLALLSININKFKYINYNYGYVTGDRVLRQLAKMLQLFVRPEELPGKTAADRFLMLLQYEDITAFKKRLKDFDHRLELSIEELQLPTSLYVSCGIYLFEPEDRDITLAIDRAHYAQETLSGGNGNAYAYYNDGILERIKSEKVLEDMMEDALKQGQFVPYFQPKVDMRTGRLVGAEALVRWKHPEKGLIAPFLFVPLFERNGFITEIDLYIFQEVCRFLHEEEKKGFALLPISCNFSRRHFANVFFPSVLRDIALKHHVNPANLELEVTETMLEDDSDRLLALLRELKREGFKIAIDDFGSGYSSLGLLNDLEADVLKVDKVFVDQLLEANRSRNIIHLIVDIAKKLDITIICEGVETREQADYLLKIGCNLAQGYLYGKPMPLDEFRKQFENEQALPDHTGSSNSESLRSKQC